MRKTAIGLAIILVAAIAVLLLAPSFVDLDRYRPVVAEKASAALGRQVTLGGPISLSLLPSPHLTIRDLRIANLPGASAPDMARAREVDAALSFWPLLAFQLDVTSARVIQPTIVLERLPDGRPNWSFESAASATSPAGATPAPVPEAFPGSPAAAGVGGVKIARLTIEDGTVDYRAPGGAIAVEHINLVLTGDAVAGPLHAEGGLTTFGATLAMRLDLGRFGGAQIPVSLALKAASLASAEFNGTVTPSGDTPALDGKLGLKAGDLGDIAALAGAGPLPPMLAKPLQVSTDVAASADRIALEHLTLELGDIHGSGAAHVKPGTPSSADLKFSVNTIDLDRFLAERAAVSAAPAAKPAGGREAAITALPRDTGTGAPRLTVPTGIDASLDLGVDAVQWHQGVIRQLRLEAALADGALTIKRLGALLPGGSDIAVSGIVGAGAPRFDGSMEASTDNFRDFLRWTGIAVEGVPADRLRRASLSSRISLDGSTLEAKAIDLGFDSSRLTGAVTMALRARPAFGARLAIDQLNLDAYLGSEGGAPSQASAAAPAAPPAPAGAVTRVSVPQAVAEALASFDANLDASADTLIWRNQPIRKVHLVSTLENRDLTVTEFSVGDIGAGTGKLSGYLQGIGGDQPKADAVFDLHGPELGRVLRLVAPGVASADNFGAFSLGGELQQQGERLSLESDLEASGGKLHLSAAAPQPDRWDLGVTLEHPSFNRMMRLVSATYRPQGGELGPVSLKGDMTWTPGAAAVKHLALDVGGMTVAGELRLQLAARPVLTADLTVGDLVVDKFLPVRQTAFLEEAAPGSPLPGVMLAQAGTRPPAPAVQHWSKAPVDLDFLRLFDGDVTLGGKSVIWASWRLADPQAKLSLKDAVLTVPQLSGQVFGGTLAATAGLKLEPQPSLAIKASLAGADLREALGSNRLDGKFDTEADLVAAGASPFDLVSGLNGTASLKSHDGAINGINVPAINQRINQVKGLGDLATLLRAATSGSTSYSSLDGTFKVTNGVAVSRDLHLVADGGEGSGTAIFDLPNWSMVSRTDLSLTGVQGSPPIGITLKGPIDQPNWDVDFNAITRALGSRAIERLIAPQPTPSQDSGSTSSGGAQSVTPQDILKNLFKH